ncbi:MAG TPA: MOSC domain-containing protein [Candidatus Acidoferrales bacterium]|nr:MOSC domain-containing protein [Candidatus Acidoferrales bacterium]
MRVHDGRLSPLGSDLPARRAADFVPGAFGENLCCAGIDEREACIGDHWQLGEAILEISQPRNPCWKLSQHLELPDLSKRIVQTGYGAGWLCRVIQPGHVQAGDRLSILVRHPARLAITQLWALTITDMPDLTELAKAAEHAALAPAWRNRLQSRLRLLAHPSR